MSLEDEIKKLTLSIIELTETIKSKNKEKLQENCRLLPISKWNLYHDWPKIGGLRHLVFNEKKMNCSSWIKRIGRRVLIDEDEFFKWVKNNNYR